AARRRSRQLDPGDRPADGPARPLRVRPAADVRSRGRLLPDPWCRCGLAAPCRRIASDPDARWPIERSIEGDDMKTLFLLITPVALSALLATTVAAQDPKPAHVTPPGNGESAAGK